MKTEQTPGPWGVSKRNPKRVIVPWKDKELSSRRMVPVTVAVCETEADARLVSVAPELRKALEALVDHVVGLGIVECEQEIASARAAILKTA